MHLDQLLSVEERRAAGLYSWRLTWQVFFIAAAVFWIALHYMDEQFFPHRFNPSRHVIVAQNPDTYELYAWKDAFGRVYTPDDPQVRCFPYAACGLLLFVLGLAVGVHYFLVQHYKMLLLLKSEHRWPPSNAQHLRRHRPKI